MPPPYYECQADKENLGEIGCELAINLPMPPRQINRTQPLHFLGSKEPAAQKRKQKGHIYLTYEPINKVTYMQPSILHQQHSVGKQPKKSRFLDFSAGRKIVIFKHCEAFKKISWKCLVGFLCHTVEATASSSLSAFLHTSQTPLVFMSQGTGIYRYSTCFLLRSPPLQRRPRFYGEKSPLACFERILYSMLPLGSQVRSIRPMSLTRVAAGNR